MPINVVLRESEDDFVVFSVGDGFYLPPGGSIELTRNLDTVLNEGGSNRQILLNIAAHLIDRYYGFHWTIKVERYDGYVYWLRYDGPELATEETSRPVMPELVKRVSRYNRDPVI